MTDMPLDTVIADPPANGIRSTPFRRGLVARGMSALSRPLFGAAG
jgi:hypothetical protein